MKIWSRIAGAVGQLADGKRVGRTSQTRAITGASWLTTRALRGSCTTAG